MSISMMCGSRAGVLYGFKREESSRSHWGPHSKTQASVCMKVLRMVWARGWLGTCHEFHRAEPSSWYCMHKSTSVRARETCVEKEGLGLLRWGRSRKTRSSWANSARPSEPCEMGVALRENRTGAGRVGFTSNGVGRLSHEVEPSCSRRGAPVVHKATGSRAARPTRRSDRRHSSSMLGLVRVFTDVIARGSPDAFSAMPILSRLASCCRRCGDSRGLPPASNWNVSAMFGMSVTPSETSIWGVSGLCAAKNASPFDVICWWKNLCSERSLL
jgi:hypothetical protein